MAQCSRAQIHFAKNAQAADIILGGTDANERAPHLASIGNSGLHASGRAARQAATSNTDRSTGAAFSEKVTVDNKVISNRYQALKTYPDGSVAYLLVGTTSTSVTYEARAV
ncbi:Hypothetical protein PHPALM_12870 [Phytophthora palmivora]|uniref:Uncharacterized protein n=1 Tax=Phytophthora palmivora TaxID=4796 RepID=A0A2P4XYU6_9STRA|nr:Hypothetical protein PHPALM_12870 [Phytophthora palmivora]